MRRLYRFWLILYAVLSLVALPFFSFPFISQAGKDSYTWLIDFLYEKAPLRYAFLGASVFLFVLSIVLLIYLLRTSYLSDTRLKMNELGFIDIDVRAIQSMALYSAKNTGAGIKRAKARVFSDKEKGIQIELLVHLYTEVEIPMQMQRIQERVKKDIEKYTGIPVTEVMVRVTHVEALATQIEK